MLPLWTRFAGFVMAVLTASLSSVRAQMRKDGKDSMNVASCVRVLGGSTVMIPVTRVEHGDPKVDVFLQAAQTRMDTKDGGGTPASSHDAGVGNGGRRSHHRLDTSLDSTQGEATGAATFLPRLPSIVVGNERQDYYRISVVWIEAGS